MSKFWEENVRINPENKFEKNPLKTGREKIMLMKTN